jgi:hypothetical protein
MTELGLECTSAPATGFLEVTGTLTVRSDSTFSDDTITRGEGVVELPPECLVAAGFVTCDSVGGPLEVSRGYSSFTCVDNEATGGCTCQTRVNQRGGMAFVSPNASTSGTYAIEGDKLTTSALGTDVQYSYCVSEGRMTMHLDTLARTGAVTGPIILVQPNHT